MTPNDIEHQIRKHLKNSVVHILDPMGDGQHLEALVVSPEFEGLPLVKQHKMVMDILKEALKNDLHSLGLKTFTPLKWESARKNYSIANEKL
jgi:stress-induced morphogen